MNRTEVASIDDGEVSLLKGSAEVLSK